MKNAKCLTGFVATALLVPAFVLFFLNMFNIVTQITQKSGGSVNPEATPLAWFGKFEGIVDGGGVWFTINCVATIVTAVFALLFIVFWLISVFSNVKSQAVLTIRSFSAIVLFVVALLTVASGVVAMLVNKTTISAILFDTSISLQPALGFWFECIALLGAFVALFTCRVKK